MARSLRVFQAGTATLRSEGMARTGDLRRRVEDLKQGVRRAAKATREAAGGPAPGVHDVNVAGRANVVIARNVGTDGSAHGASAIQRTRIRQSGDETHEQTETTRSTW